MIRSLISMFNITPTLKRNNNNKRMLTRVKKRRLVDVNDNDLKNGEKHQQLDIQSMFSMVVDNANEEKRADQNPD